MNDKNSENFDNKLIEEKAYWNGIENLYSEKDVILAVEETIKRIEEQIKSFDRAKDATKILHLQHEIQGYINGLNYSKKIIKEQFPIIEKVEK